MKYDNQQFVSKRPFYPWQPSTWPEPSQDIFEFIKDLKIIFEDTIISEIKNVISDAQKTNGDIQHRGHVIALALFCAIDTLSSYAFIDEQQKVCRTCGRHGEKIGPRYSKFIQEFFPNDYKPYAEKLYKSYRTSLVHSWNLFSVGMTPGNDAITETNEVLTVGLLNFSDALQKSVSNFTEKLQNDTYLQKNVLERYNFLRKSAVA